MQSGFRSNHSCQTAMTSLLDKWLKVIEEGNLVGAVYFYLCKAFDLLNHKLLLQTLYKCKCFYKSNYWFISCLAY